MALSHRGWLRGRFPRFAHFLDGITGARARRLRLYRFEGIDLWVDPRNHREPIGPEVTAAITRLLPSGSTMLELGAQGGELTTLASRAVGPGGLVIAVEPDPADRGLLLRNLRLNRCVNVDVERAAFRDLRPEDLVEPGWPIDMIKLGVAAGGLLDRSDFAATIERWRERIVLFVELGSVENTVLDRIEGLGLSLFMLDGKRIDRADLLEPARPTESTTVLASARSDLEELLGDEEKLLAEAR